MPHFYENILCVTVEELVPRFWNTYSALKVELWRYKDKNYGLKRVTPGGNGRILRVEFDSLDREIQEAIGDIRKHGHPLLPFYEEDPEARIYYTNFTYPDGSYLLDQAKEQYIVNSNVLRAVIRLKEERQIARATNYKPISKRRGILRSLSDDVNSFNEFLLAHHGVEHTLPSHPKRFNQAFKAYLKEDYISLIKDAKGNSKRNAIKIDENTAALLNSLFAGRHYKPNASEVAVHYQAFIDGQIDVVSNVTGELLNPEDFKPLSKSAISMYLSTYESKIGTHAKRSGNRQVLNGQFIPYQTLKQPLFSGSMISIDDRQPPFKYDKNNRMWWYIGVDLASLAIVAWAYGKTKEELILNFYRQLVINHHEWGVNLPDALECESSLNSSFKDNFLRPGAMFQNVNIYPNSARSKRVERIIGSIRQDEKKHAGWVARPFYRSEANQQSAQKEITIPYEQLTDQCFKDIIDWNNSPSNQDKSISRFDYFKKNQNPELKPINWAGFIQQLGYETKSSCNAGIIKLQGQEWLIGRDGEILTGENLITILKMIEGENVTLYWMPNNEGKVMKAMVYTIGGRLICEAISKPVSARAPIEETDEQREARSKVAAYIKTIDAYMRQQKNAIELVTLIDNRQTTISNSFGIPGRTKYQSAPENREVEIIDDDEFELEPQHSRDYDRKGSSLDRFRTLE